MIEAHSCFKYQTIDGGSAVANVSSYGGVDWRRIVPSDKIMTYENRRNAAEPRDRGRGSGVMMSVNDIGGVGHVCNSVGDRNSKGAYFVRYLPKAKSVYQGTMATPK